MCFFKSKLHAPIRLAANLYLKKVLNIFGLNELIGLNPTMQGLLVDYSSERYVT